MKSRIDHMIEKSFLGSEFLTWLWYASEQGDGSFELDEETVEVRFEDLLVLESILADSQENTFRGGEPTRSEEARLALRLGKKVSRARLRLCLGEREWGFGIRASTLDLSSIRLPAVLSTVEDDQIYERLYLIEELDHMVNGLYLGFLRTRLGPGWEEELSHMRAWVESAPDQGGP